MDSGRVSRPAGTRISSSPNFPGRSRKRRSYKTQVAIAEKRSAATEPPAIVQRRMIRARIIFCAASISSFRTWTSCTSASWRSKSRVRRRRSKAEVPGLRRICRSSVEAGVSGIRGSRRDASWDVFSKREASRASRAMAGFRSRGVPEEERV